MKKFIVTTCFLTLTGCYSITQDATFVVKGQVKDSNGALQIVTAGDQLELCLDVNYAVSNKGSSQDAQVTTECSTLVTDQKGNFTFTKALKLQAMSADALEIKNAKVYSRKLVYSGSSNYYIFPASLESISLTNSGGQIQTTVHVF